MIIETISDVSPRDIRVGTRIVTKQRAGNKIHAVTARELLHQPRGCVGKVHVGIACYDYSGFVTVKSYVNTEGVVSDG